MKQQLIELMMKINMDPDMKFPFVRTIPDYINDIIHISYQYNKGLFRSTNIDKRPRPFL